MIGVFVWMGLALASPGAVSEWSLPSGVALLHRQDNRFPVVRVVVSLHAGAADEPDGKGEVAHLAEHLAFRAVMDGEPVEAALRAAGCWYNAETSLDMTLFLMECPKDAAAVPLRFASALATNALVGLDPAVVAVEANVVLAEGTQRGDRGVLTLDALSRVVFTGAHPYNIDAGPPDAALTLTLPDVLAFYASHYRTDRTVVAVEGDFDTNQLATWVTQAAGDAFAHPRQRGGDVADWPSTAVGWMGSGERPVPWFRDPDHPEAPLGPGAPNAAIRRVTPSPPLPAGAEPRRVTLSGGWPLALVAWYLPPATAESWWAISSAPTFAEVDVRRAVGRADSILDLGCGSVPGERGSVLVCWAELDDEAEREEVAERMAGAFDVPYTYPREQAERAADEDDAVRWRRAIWDDAGGIEALADIVRYRTSTGLFDLRSRELQSVGGGQGAAAWRTTYPTWLGRDRASIVYVDPEGRDSVDAGRAARVGGGDPREVWPAPDLGLASGGSARQDRLPNGLQVVTLPVPGVPIGAWRLAVPAGPGTEHIAAFLDPTLRTPAQLDGNALLYDWDTDSRGAGALLGVNQGGSWDPVQVLRSLWGTVQARKTANLDAAFRRRVREEVYDGRSPYTWRDRLWRRAVRARPEIDGLPELDAVVRDRPAVEAYLRTRFRPENATLLVVGKLNAEVAKRVAAEMGDWSVRGDPVPDPWTVEREPPAPGIVVLDSARGGRTVSVRWSCPTSEPGGAPPDPLVTALLEEVARVRLFQAVRASAGLSYTPVVWADPLWGTVDLHFRAETELGLEARVLTLVRKVAGELGSRPASDAELAAARRGVYSEQLRSRASTLGLAESLADALLDFHTLDAATAAGPALLTVDAARLAAFARGCDTEGVALLVGPEREVAGNLEDAGLVPQVFDWRAAHLALVERWLPARLRREEEFLQHQRE